MLVTTAANLTISNNTITGTGTDIGIAVSAGSTNITIENNVIERTAPGSPDPVGVGVQVDAASTGAATLVCNTFSGWVAALDNVTQAPCIITTTLPNGTVESPYSAALEGTTPNGPLTWSLVRTASGLTLAPDGSISGTPTERRDVQLHRHRDRQHRRSGNPGVHDHHCSGPGDDHHHHIDSAFHDRCHYGPDGHDGCGPDEPDHNGRARDPRHPPRHRRIE